EVDPVAIGDAIVVVVDVPRSDGFPVGDSDLAVLGEAVYALGGGGIDRSRLCVGAVEVRMVFADWAQADLAFERNDLTGDQIRRDPGGARYAIGLIRFENRSHAIV